MSSDPYHFIAAVYDGHFLASGGMPSLAGERGLRIAARRVLGGGSFAVCVLEP